MDKERIIQELNFQAIRSSGAGGQHVNKVSSKVVLNFDLNGSQALSQKEKLRIIQSLENRLTKDNFLQLKCDESRSQHKNKQLVTRRFLALIKSALKVPKKRKKTKPGAAATEKRLQTKRKDALKKINRQRPKMD